MIPLIIILSYMTLLLTLGLLSNRFFRGTSRDYFVASHSIGPFLLLMSVFGTTMTAFALVGSTGKSFERGIGVYGLMASISGLVHAGVFFLVGIRLWVFGKRYGYVTQIQYFRDRFDSNLLGYLLFPILVGLVIPYLLIGVIGAGNTVLPVTQGAFPELFPNLATPQWAGGIPKWLSGLVVCGIVLMYVFAGGSRGAAWANTFQTIVFMAMGVVAFFFIYDSLGGLQRAAEVPATITDDGRLVQTFTVDPDNGQVIRLEEPKTIARLKDPEQGRELAGRKPHFSRTVVPIVFPRRDAETGEMVTAERELGVPPLMFATYMFIPLSVGMFPHLFQHWLTARSARSFQLTLVAHPLFIMVVWVPCVFIGAWASGLMPLGVPPAAVLANMLSQLVGNPVLIGLLTAGVLAAIMSSLDSQFLCLGTMFTNDIVLHAVGRDRFSDRQTIWIARSFVIVIVSLTYVLALVAMARRANVFDLAVWCFSGFSALFPLVLAAIYWKRATKAGAYASVLAAVAVWLYYFLQSGGREYTLPGGVMPVTVALAASAAAMIVVSLLTSPPSEATLRKFFPRRERDRDAHLERKSDVLVQR
jgi:SSS family solute:Na+ symporter